MVDNCINSKLEIPLDISSSLLLGAREGMPKDIVSRMDEVEKRSADKTRININIAVNYGSRDEIVHGVKDIVREIQKGNISIDDIDENLISSQCVDHFS